MNPFHLEPLMYVHSISTGFIEIPNKISLNVYPYGCRKRCDGCQNANLQDFKQENAIDADRFSAILSRYGLASWVCFLGGDAVYQPKGLDVLCEVSQKHSKKVCLYTGLRFEELYFINKSNINLIIDGEWDEKSGDIHSKSTNQRIFLRLSSDMWQRVKYEDLLTLKA